MNCNEYISALKIWSFDKCDIYLEEYENKQGMSYVNYMTALELGFKLSMLIDKEFSSLEDLENSVLKTLDTHYTGLLKHPKNAVAQYMMQKVNKEFSEYMHQIIVGNCQLPEAQIEYERTIVGEEAERIVKQIKDVWGYVNTDYWYPLCVDELNEVPNKFWIKYSYLEPYWETIVERLGLFQKRVYSYGESAYDIIHCYELEGIETGVQGECVYTDKDFMWLIYFSHEETVAFAGTIVDEVKEILAKEKEHWNHWE